MTTHAEQPQMMLTGCFCQDWDAARAIWVLNPLRQRAVLWVMVPHWNMTSTSHNQANRNWHWESCPPTMSTLHADSVSVFVSMMARCRPLMRDKVMWTLSMNIQKRILHV